MKHENEATTGDVSPSMVETQALIYLSRATNVTEDNLDSRPAVSIPALKRLTTRLTGVGRIIIHDEKEIRYLRLTLRGFKMNMIEAKSMTTQLLDSDRSDVSYVSNYEEK